MYKFLLGVLLFFTISGCEKEKDPVYVGPPVTNQPDCEKNTYGSFTFFSGKSNPYLIYINGVFKGTIGSFGSLKIEYVNTDCYSVKVEQASGYVLYPTILTGTHCIKNCTNTEISF